jgi:DNA-binding transcriptional MerR regulator
MASHRDLVALGLTSRVVDYWVRRGYLQPDSSSPGIGFKRHFTDEEVAVAALMHRLVTAGLTVEAAAKVARAGGQLELAPGVRVEAVAA